ncbi:MAG: BlaI family penicillinase repressor [Pirellulaceae bacterium]|jgi:BlaI family penicillinase repressor
MNAKRSKIRLTASEMELMSLLWDHGPLSIAEAHKLFPKYGSPIGYPTMQTRLNRLVDKNLARRMGIRPARYESGVSNSDVATGHLDELLEKLSCESVAPLVSHLISERPLTSGEIDELRELLEKAERDAERRGGAE